MINKAGDELFRDQFEFRLLTLFREIWQRPAYHL